MRRKKNTEATAARQAAERVAADLAEARALDALAKATEVIEFADIPEEEAEKAVQALADATGGALTPDAVEAVARTTGRPKVEVAGVLATAEADGKAYRLWMESKNLSNSDPQNPDHVATVTLGLVDRRRKKLDQKIERTSDEETLELLRAEERRLDELEDASWSHLHPIVYGGTRGAEPRPPVDLSLPMYLTNCAWCGAGMDRHRAFENPACDTCTRAAALSGGMEEA